MLMQIDGQVVFGGKDFMQWVPFCLLVNMFFSRLAVPFIKQVVADGSCLMLRDFPVALVVAVVAVCLLLFILCFSVCIAFVFLLLLCRLFLFVLCFFFNVCLIVFMFICGLSLFQKM